MELPRLHTTQASKLKRTSFDRYSCTQRVSFFIIIKKKKIRLRGVALVVPAINYWWSCLPAETAAEAYSKVAKQDQWAFRIAHYLPFFFYSWMTQKWFDASAVSEGNPIVLSEEDKKISERVNKERQITGVSCFSRVKSLASVFTSISSFHNRSRTYLVYSSRT